MADDKFISGSVSVKVNASSSPVRLPSISLFETPKNKSEAKQVQPNPRREPRKFKWDDEILASHGEQLTLDDLKYRQDEAQARYLGLRKK